MSLSTPAPGANISDLLIAGTLALVSDGNLEPTVRQIAERSGRSTMCVYSDFGGRRKLVESAHRRAAEDLIASMETKGEAEDAMAAAEEWLQRERGIAQWLFSPGAPAASRAELIGRFSAAVGDEGTDRLALVLGRLLLTA